MIPQRVDSVLAPDHTITAAACACTSKAEVCRLTLERKSLPCAEQDWSTVEMHKGASVIVSQGASALPLLNFYTFIMRNQLRHAPGLLWLSYDDTITLSQILPSPQFVTDPKLIPARTNGTAPRLPFEKALHDARVGSSSGHGRQDDAFISNMRRTKQPCGPCPDGGWPTQITVRDQRQSSPEWSPDGKWIAYIFRHGRRRNVRMCTWSPLQPEGHQPDQHREIAEIDAAVVARWHKLAWEVKA